jgi:hypothetical protein
MVGSGWFMVMFTRSRQRRRSPDAARSCSRDAAASAWGYLVERVDALPAAARDEAWVEVARVLTALPHADPEARDRRLIRAGYEAGLSDGRATL